MLYAPVERLETVEQRRTHDITNTTPEVSRHHSPRCGDDLANSEEAGR
jgi:hypothetical protein